MHKTQKLLIFFTLCFIYTSLSAQNVIQKRYKKLPNGHSEKYYNKKRNKLKLRIDKENGKVRSYVRYYRNGIIKEHYQFDSVGEFHGTQLFLSRNMDTTGVFEYEHGHIQSSHEYLYYRKKNGKRFIRQVVKWEDPNLKHDRKMRNRINRRYAAANGYVKKYDRKGKKESEGPRDHNHKEGHWAFYNKEGDVILEKDY